MTSTARLAIVALFAALPACRPSQPATTPTPQPEDTAPTPVPERGPRPGAARPGAGGRPGAPGAGGQRPGGQAQEPRPYEEVITDKAMTRDGLFKTHQVGSKFYFEIPRSALGQEMLLVTRAARVPVNGGYGGQQVGPRLVVRWERRDHRVLVRSVSYQTVADSTTPIYEAVRNSNHDIVVGGFNVEAYGPDSAAVIDVGRFYTAPPPELRGGRRWRGNPDQNRSMIERVVAFPENVEVEALLTFPPPPTAGPGGGGGGGNPFAPTASGTQSVVLHWSMVKLPENPMMPRLADKRIGFFSLQQVDYGRPEQRAQQRRYIVRWRLEKKNPNAAMSEPVKPITYYIDPNTPDWLKPYVRQGIEDWQPAFEEAGFIRGIVAKDAPSKEEDPDWSPEDARHSVVRWFPSTIENATGPNVHDPRTGEILEADIYMYHNIMNLQRSWYFTQVGHLDPRARMWPYPDSLMGRLVQFVVAHEVGHTLGYQHDQKGSSTYPVDSVRSRTWVARMGHSPSIMDYSRFNYTAQPEDRIALEDLIPRIGPWDKYITRWGYSPIPRAKSSDDEWPTLDRWSREQDSVPWFRFNLSDSEGADPGDHTEAVGDADPVKATTWGLMSIKQLVPLLVPATVQSAQPFDDLDQMYGRLIQQWTREMNHVAMMVGGANAQEKYAGQSGPRYVPWPKARQKQAVQFLNQQAFATPEYFIVDDILRLIEVEGAIERINRAQTGVLNTLFNDRRLERLIENEAMASRSRDAYSLGEMLSDVRGGIWTELSSGRVRISPYRRELQRSYLNAVNGKINPTPPTLPPNLPARFRARFAPARATSDIKSMFKAQLRTLDGTLRGAIGRAGDQATRAHLQDARDQIAEILDPKK